MEISNLWEETIEVLSKYNKTWDDIKSISSIEENSESPQIFLIKKDYFYRIAKDLEYNSDFGIHHINRNLTLWGDGFYIERDIYDGLENWIYKPIPSKDTKEKSLRRLIVSHEDLNS